MFEAKHKVTINISLTDAKDLWSLIHGESSKYSASRVDTNTTMKYFNHGVQVMRTMDFIKAYREQSTYAPLTPWMILISLAGDIEPNGAQIVRRRNRTSLAMSCTVDSIMESGQIWNDPGLALDPTQIKYNSTHVDYRSGKVTIRASVPQGLELKETPFMYAGLFKKLFARFVAEFKQLNNISNVDHFASREGEDILVDSVISFLTQMGYTRATAKPARDRIAEWLIHGTDSNAYVVKGVPFANELAYTSMLAAWDGDEARILRIQHDRPIVERLMAEHRDDPLARLREMDLNQLSLPPDMNAAVMDFQIGLDEDEWSQYNEAYNTADPLDRDQIVKLWQDRVINRWKALQK